MVRKLGPMKKVLGMMPGMSQMTSSLDVDEREMNRLEALFTSMTPRERLQPQILDMSRRRRIARGSGQEVGAVNELLKRFKGMKMMMKQLNKMGLGSMLGGKAKREALRDLSPTGELAAPAGGGLGGLFGGFGRGGASPDPSALGGLFGSGPRPMGSSATRKSGGKSKRKKDKRSRKGRKRK
jgi:signal recognition particle subunit SRP54